MESAKIKCRKRERDRTNGKRKDRMTEKYYAFTTNNFALLKYFLHLE